MCFLSQDTLQGHKAQVLEHCSVLNEGEFKSANTQFKGIRLWTGRKNIGTQLVLYSKQLGNNRFEMFWVSVTEKCMYAYRNIPLLFFRKFLEMQSKRRILKCKN